MTTEPSSRLPISTRHAFALAFDLALRRDPLHSLVVPLLLHTPWILALALLPPVADSPRSGLIVLVGTIAAAGDFLTHTVIGAMRRVRARSVFNTPAGTPPAPVGECYGRGLRRVPWLLVTEALRNLSITFASFFLVFPGLFLGYKLAFATEAAVLNEPDTAGAFQRSFRYSVGRFERWLEMVVASVMLAISVIFTSAVVSLAFPAPSINGWGAILLFLVVLIVPVIQYAWTFFYLRLVEIDPAERGIEVGPVYAEARTVEDSPVETIEPTSGTPRLTLVAPLAPDRDEGEHGPSV